MLKHHIKLLKLVACATPSQCCSMLMHFDHIRCGGLNAVRDWTDELSVGEQQRLSFARVLAHPVPLAFLDEATRYEQLLLQACT